MSVSSLSSLFPSVSLLGSVCTEPRAAGSELAQHPSHRPAEEGQHALVVRVLQTVAVMTLVTVAAVAECEGLAAVKPETATSAAPRPAVEASADDRSRRTTEKAISHPLQHLGDRPACQTSGRQHVNVVLAASHVMTEHAVVQRTAVQHVTVAEVQSAAVH